MKARELAEMLMKEPDADVRMAYDFRMTWGIKVSKAKFNNSPLIILTQRSTEHTEMKHITDQEELKI